MLTPTTKRQIGEANGNCLACTVVARGLFFMSPTIERQMQESSRVPLSVSPQPPNAIEEREGALLPLHSP
jgi:hypothetical protein